MKFNEKTEAKLKEIANDIIRDLHKVARETDNFELGLPVGYDGVHEEMVNKVVENLKKVAGMFRWTA